jgi:DNA-binding response OmpR family regulator
MKLLVVDDDPGICRMLVRVFRADGYTVLAVASGAEALDLLGRESVDLVLLDYYLKDMEAGEILARARERQWAVPMIVMSGMGERETAEKALREGAASILDKPFDLADIRRRVKEHLSALSDRSDPSDLSGLPRRGG